MGLEDQTRRMIALPLRLSSVVIEMANAQKELGQGDLLEVKNALIRARADINRALATVKTRGAQ